MTLKLLRLRNGSEETEPVVRTTMMSLQALWGRNPVDVIELAAVCKDPQHEPFADSGDVLRRLRLLEPSGQPHPSVRNVVLSAVAGEGVETHLVNPMLPEGDGDDAVS